MFQNMFKNWQTAAAGVGAICFAIIHLVFASLHSLADESTWIATVSAILGGIGLIAAGDARRSVPPEDLVKLTQDIAKAIQTGDTSIMFKKDAIKKPTDLQKASGLSSGPTLGLLMLGVMALVACVSLSLSDNVWRSEQAAVDVVTAAHEGWVAYYTSETNKPNLSTNRLAYLNAVEVETNDARMRFAADVGIVEALRAQFVTNSAVELQLKAAAAVLPQSSSNAAWLMRYYSSAASTNK